MCGRAMAPAVSQCLSQAGARGWQTLLALARAALGEHRAGKHHAGEAPCWGSTTLGKHRASWHRGRVPPAHAPPAGTRHMSGDTLVPRSSSSGKS